MADDLDKSWMMQLFSKHKELFKEHMSDEELQEYEVSGQILTQEEIEDDKYANANTATQFTEANGEIYWHDTYYQEENDPEGVRSVDPRQFVALYFERWGVNIDQGTGMDGDGYKELNTILTNWEHLSNLGTDTQYGAITNELDPSDIAVLESDVAGAGEKDNILKISEMLKVVTGTAGVAAEQGDVNEAVTGSGGVSQAIKDLLADVGSDDLNETLGTAEYGTVLDNALYDDVLTTNGSEIHRKTFVKAMLKYWLREEHGVGRMQSHSDQELEDTTLNEIIADPKTITGPRMMQLKAIIDAWDKLGGGDGTIDSGDVERIEASVSGDTDGMLSFDELADYATKFLAEKSVNEGAHDPTNLENGHRIVVKSEDGNDVLGVYHAMPNENNEIQIVQYENTDFDAEDALIMQKGDNELISFEGFPDNYTVSITDDGTLKFKDSGDNTVPSFMGGTGGLTVEQGGDAHISINEEEEVKGLEGLRDNQTVTQSTAGNNGQVTKLEIGDVVNFNGRSYEVTYGGLALMDEQQSDPKLTIEKGIYYDVEIAGERMILDGQEDGTLYQAETISTDPGPLTDLGVDDGTTRILNNFQDITQGSTAETVDIHETETDMEVKELNYGDIIKAGEKYYSFNENGQLSVIENVPKDAEIALTLTENTSQAIALPDMTDTSSPTVALYYKDGKLFLADTDIALLNAENPINVTNGTPGFSEGLIDFEDLEASQTVEEAQTNNLGDLPEDIQNAIETLGIDYEYITADNIIAIILEIHPIPGLEGQTVKSLKESAILAKGDDASILDAPLLQNNGFFTNGAPIFNAILQEFGQKVLVNSDQDPISINFGDASSANPEEQEEHLKNLLKGAAGELNPDSNIGDENINLTIGLLEEYVTGKGKQSDQFLNSLVSALGEYLDLYGEDIDGVGSALQLGHSAARYKQLTDAGVNTDSMPVTLKFEGAYIPVQGDGMGGLSPEYETLTVTIDYKTANQLLNDGGGSIDYSQLKGLNSGVVFQNSAGDEIGGEEFFNSVTEGNRGGVAEMASEELSGQYYAVPDKDENAIINALTKTADTIRMPTNFTQDGAKLSDYLEMALQHSAEWSFDTKTTEVDTGKAGFEDNGVSDSDPKTVTETTIGLTDNQDSTEKILEDTLDGMGFSEEKIAEEFQKIYAETGEQLTDEELLDILSPEMASGLSESQERVKAVLDEKAKENMEEHKVTGILEGVGAIPGLAAMFVAGPAGAVLAGIGVLLALPGFVKMIADWAKKLSDPEQYDELENVATALGHENTGSIEDVHKDLESHLTDPSAVDFAFALMMFADLFQTGYSLAKIVNKMDMPSGTSTGATDAVSDATATTGGSAVAGSEFENPAIISGDTEFSTLFSDGEKGTKFAQIGDKTYEVTKGDDGVITKQEVQADETQENGFKKVGEPTEVKSSGPQNIAEGVEDATLDLNNYSDFPISNQRQFNDGVVQATSYLRDGGFQLLPRIDQFIDDLQTPPSKTSAQKLIDTIDSIKQEIDKKIDSLAENLQTLWNDKVKPTLDKMKKWLQDTFTNRDVSSPNGLQPEIFQPNPPLISSLNSTQPIIVQPKKINSPYFTGSSGKLNDGTFDALAGIDVGEPVKLATSAGRNATFTKTSAGTRRHSTQEGKAVDKYYSAASGRELDAEKDIKRILPIAAETGGTISYNNIPHTVAKNRTTGDYTLTPKDGTEQPIEVDAYGNPVKTATSTTTQPSTGGTAANNSLAGTTQSNPKDISNLAEDATFADFGLAAGDVGYINFNGRTLKVEATLNGKGYLVSGLEYSSTENISELGDDFPSVTSTNNNVATTKDVPASKNDPAVIPAKVSVGGQPKKINSPYFTGSSGKLNDGTFDALAGIDVGEPVKLATSAGRNATFTKTSAGTRRHSTQEGKAVDKYYSAASGRELDAEKDIKRILPIAAETGGTISYNNIPHTVAKNGTTGDYTLTPKDGTQPIEVDAYGGVVESNNPANITANTTFEEIVSRIESIGYTKTVNSKFIDSHPNYLESMNDSLVAHGTNSSTLLAFKNGSNKGRLLPTGQLLKNDQVPFYGKLDIGISNVGVNNNHFSTSVITNGQGPMGYADLWDTKKMNEMQLWDMLPVNNKNDWKNYLETGKLDTGKYRVTGDDIEYQNLMINRFEYEKSSDVKPWDTLLTSGFYQEGGILKNLDFLQKKLDIMDRRRAMYETLSSIEQDYIDNPFKMILGFLPRDGRKGVPPKFTHEELAFRDGMHADEINAILVPREKIDFVSEYIGKEWLNSNNIQVAAIEDAYQSSK